jgi:hypothetical protein
MGMDIYGRKPVNETGEYFRANVWAWRPIHYLCTYVMTTKGFKTNTEGWGHNDGYGLRTHAQCVKLATALEELITTDDELKNHETIYLNGGGMWVTEGGQFVSDKYKTEIGKKRPANAIIFDGLTMADGTKVYPAYSTRVEWVKEWIGFLLNCGGFKIY